MPGHAPPLDPRIQFWPTATLTFMGLVFGLVMGLGATLFTLDRTDPGFGTGMAAANGMMHAPRAPGITPVKPRLVSHPGTLRELSIAHLIRMSAR